MGTGSHSQQLLEGTKRQFEAGAFISGKEGSGDSGGRQASYHWFPRPPSDPPQPQPLLPLLLL